MRKIIYLIIVFASFATLSFAQQIKRQTLSSVGRSRTTSNFRLTYSAGLCPGCNTLNNTTGGFVRQNFQQPPNIHERGTNCKLLARFDVTSNPSTCGTNYDFEFTGAAESGTTYLWQFGEGATPSTSTEVNVMGVGYTSIGLKTVILTIKRVGTNNDTCIESAAHIINITENMVIFRGSLSVQNISCKGSKTGSLTVVANGGTGTPLYRWSNGATTANISNLTPGRYSVTATDNNNCTFKLDTTVVEPAMALSLVASVIKESCTGYKNGSIRLAPNGGTKPYKYEWGNGAQTQIIDSLTKGDYRVTVTDSLGCRIDTVFSIAVGCKEPGADKPQAGYDTFTPNGDNANDTWIVIDIDKYPNNETFIYNRWGQLVFNKVGYTGDWNGTNVDGEDLPTAAYFYVIKLNDPKGTILSGSVTLIR